MNNKLTIGARAGARQIAISQKAFLSNRPWLYSVFLCALVSLIDGYDMVVAPVSVPILAGVWNVEAQAFSVALAGSIFGMALGAIAIAPLGDRVGRRPVLIGCVLLVGISSIFTPLVTTTVEFAFLRILTGLGMGASLAVALALGAEAAPENIRGRVITCIYSMSALGAALGALVAGPLLSAYGWKSLYVVGGLIPLALVPVLAASLPESTDFRDTTVQRNGAHKSIKIMGVSALLREPYRGRTSVLWSLYFLSTFTIYVISSWLPTLMHLNGWSIDDATKAIMAFSFGGIGGGVLLGWLVDKGHTKLSLLGALLLSCLAMFLLVTVAIRLWQWMLFITLIGAGLIGVTYSIAALSGLLYPTELRAAGIGSASALGRVGAIFAPIMGGYLLSLGATPVQIFTALLVPVVTGTAIALLFANKLRVSRADGV